MRTNQFLRVVNRLAESGVDACWEWPLSRLPHGYGHLAYGALRKKSARAHRVAFELFVRPLSPDEVVMHVCDNPPCINPAHLKAGTQADNIADRERKGRGKNARPTCKRGHPFGDKTEVKDGYTARVCVICRRENERARYKPTGRPIGRPRKTA